MIEAEGAIRYIDDIIYITTDKATEEVATKLEQIYRDVAVL